MSLEPVPAEVDPYGPNQFLRSWKGTLQTDGYSGYNEVARTNGLTRAGCWAHARRKVKDALETGVSKAVPVLLPVQRLFWIERAVKKRVLPRGLSAEQRNQLRAGVRHRLSSRFTERIHGRALQIWEDPLIVPKSKLGKAVRYIDNQWEPLTCFLEDPELELHNNDSERTLRHVVTLARAGCTSAIQEVGRSAATCMPWSRRARRWRSTRRPTWKIS